MAQWHGKLELFSACLPQHVVEELLCRRGRRVSAKQLLVSNEILGSSDDGERDHLSERPARQLRAKPSSRFSPTETVEDATETFELFRRRGRDKEGAFTLYSLESWRDRPSCRRQIEVEKCLEQKGQEEAKLLQSKTNRCANARAEASAVAVVISSLHISNSSVWTMKMGHAGAQQF